MDQPRVLCVMLTKDRPELARKAVECFRKQTYGNKRLFILNSDPVNREGGALPAFSDPPLIKCVRIIPKDFDTVGRLRNLAIQTALPADVIIHWDDDDYSHPRRIDDQVNTLILGRPGNQCTGYSSMLFWNSVIRESWLYESAWSVLGTSLCYYRSAWEKNLFEHLNNGEDTRFVSKFMAEDTIEIRTSNAMGALPPAMIARIHSGNAHRECYRPEVMRAIESQGGEWTRVPAWDDYCRETLGDS